MCWAFQEGLIREEDEQHSYQDRVNYATASLLIFRYAQFAGVETPVDAQTLTQTMEDYPDLSEETVRALIWCYEESFLTGSTGELEQILDRSGNRINRAQMATFLFRFCTYKLDVNEQ